MFDQKLTGGLLLLLENGVQNRDMLLVADLITERLPGGNADQVQKIHKAAHQLGRILIMERIYKGQMELVIQFDQGRGRLPILSGSVILVFQQERAHLCGPDPAAPVTETHSQTDRGTECINTAASSVVSPPEAAEMLQGFRDYFVSHGENVYENPSPGNKAGGITTLEDKSCGCVQKGGTAPIVGVVPYGGRVETPGLNLLWGPGNDLVSTTALSAAGAHLILFTTGRGTPFGAPVPTLKIASNSSVAARKPQWIDFNAGAVAEGQSIDETAQRLYQLVLDTAAGAQTGSERANRRGIAIFKDGVTL